MLGGQLRIVGGMGGAGPVGLDFAAALAFGGARGCDQQLLADVLPALEGALLARHRQGDEDDEMMDEGDAR